MAERVTRVIVTALLIFGYTAGWAAAENPAAARDIARGHDLLAAARLEPAGEERETLLSEAVEAFKSSYRWFGRDTQVRALLGAAQGYLMMQTPRRVFPFLWQATPLQRAERTAQQALVDAAGQPGGIFPVGAHILAPGDDRQGPRRGHGVGQPIRRQGCRSGDAPGGSRGGWQAVRRTPFVMGDASLLLRYADACGTGQPADLLFVYGKGGNRYVSVVVAMGKAYPLLADAMNGTAANGGAFVDANVEPQPQGAPRIVIHVRRNGRQTAESFVWNGDRFVSSN